jgi:hypothetical protein
VTARVYLSAPQTDWRPELEGRHLLVTYAEAGQMRLLDAGWDCPGWLVDSGAFTTWRLGRPVALAAYIDALLRLEERAANGAIALDGYIALDAIPGAPGRMPTLEEAMRATETSMANLATMQAAGLNPIPIFHEGEPLEVLDMLVGQRHHVIALGATASRGQARVLDWLLPIFETYPNQRFHGLGMTQAKLLASLPFDSVDSTSWLNPCRYGLKSNAYLIKGRSRAFWKGMGFDLPPGDIDAAVADLAGRDRAFLRRLGAEAILDCWRCPAGSPPTKGGQLLVAPTADLGGVPRAPSMASRSRVVQAAAPRSRPVAPGQLPLWLLRLLARRLA